MRPVLAGNKVEERIEISAPAEKSLGHYPGFLRANTSVPLLGSYR